MKNSYIPALFVLCCMLSGGATAQIPIPPKKPPVIFTEVNKILNPGFEGGSSLPYWKNVSLSTSDEYGDPANFLKLITSPHHTGSYALELAMPINSEAFNTPAVEQILSSPLPGTDVYKGAVWANAYGSEAQLEVAIAYTDGTVSDRFYEVDSTIVQGGWTQIDFTKQVNETKTILSISFSTDSEFSGSAAIDDVELDVLQIQS